MLNSLISNVPLSTSNTLAYIMLTLVAFFLISGFSITYYYLRKVKKMKAAAPTGSA